MSVKERFHLKRFSYHGQLSVVVIDDETEFPALLPLLYLQSWGLSRAVNTLQQHMVSICQWYNYWHRKHQRSFDDALFVADRHDVRTLAPLNALDAALADYAGFSAYIDSRQKSIDVIEGPGFKSAVANATHDVRLGCLTQFLLFLAHRYVSGRYTGLTSKEQKTTLDSYRFRLQAARRVACGQLHVRKRTTISQAPQGQLVVRERSLTSEEVRAISACSRPSTSKQANHLNPWQRHADLTQVPALQVRNHLMIRILNNYGLRLGELLLLRTKSLVPYASGAGYALAVTTYEGTGDPRQVTPKLKNAWSERLIELAPEDVKLWELYVDRIRGRPPHPFLLVNTRKNCDPLSMRAAQNVFSSLYVALDQHFPALCCAELGGALATLNAHMFRFTWATDTFESLVDRDGCDFEAAKDRLRALGGWSDRSPMPEKYAARYIAKSANAANVRRVTAQRRQHTQSTSTQLESNKL